MKIRLLVAVLLSLFAGCSDRDAPGRTSLPLHSLTLNVSGREVRLWLALFEADKFTVRVIDNAASATAADPPYSNLEAAMRATGCVAGCNASFFNRQPFDPVGLMISDGRKTGSYNPKSWMKGLLVVRADGPALELTDTFQPDQPGVTALIQSGPWLVRAGRSETDDNNTQQARRTFIGHNGHGVWFLGASEDCTLQELANCLRGAAVRAVVDVQAALNFDGGPSSGLWIKGTPANFYEREGWVVRNFIGLEPKSPTPAR
jgi:exopolysaccharide biosynthesis protein